MNGENTSTKVGIGRHLSMLSAWGLSFGLAVGWGAFVMPGAEFLPSAGPLGTVVGIVVGALAMAIIGWNYHRMVTTLPGPGGAYLYAQRAFGSDYGYLAAWSLTLAYMAILWANATALVLLVRYMFGDVLQFGWHDTLAGFDIYLGEVLLSVAVMIVAGVVCLWRKYLAGRIQAALAVFMLIGVATCFFFALSRHEGGLPAMAPAFAPNGAKPLSQILRILAMMPWAFVGFEAVSHSSAEFGFSFKKLWRVLVAAIAASAAMYAMLAVFPVLSHPGGFATWTDYLTGSRGLAGLDSMPTFAAVRTAMGQGGVALLGCTMFAAIFTGIVGAVVAMSRLIYALSVDEVFPRWQWLGKLDRNASPRNAILLVVGVSLVIPFFGRTVIGWPVEVSSIGAAVAYCVTSASAFKLAKKAGDTLTCATGLAGVVMSIIFCLLLLVPNYISGNALSAESYLVLALWCIGGFALYWHAFKNDTHQRFGRSPVVWTGIVILIFFSSLMWVRLATQRATGRTVGSIVEYSARHCEKYHGTTNAHALHDEEGYVNGLMDVLNADRQGYDIVQMALLVFSLVIMFSLYATQRRREEVLEVAQAKAEARDRAKSAFLSTISHDIRTPMNAIIGYIELAKRQGVPEATLREYISKMESSSHHLLALITDVLEMSRIESGKIELEPVPVDLVAVFDELADLFAAQMDEKDLDFSIDVARVSHRRVMCDRSRLNRILLNLVSNAWKFTPAGGRITATLVENPSTKDGEGFYELRVKDNGLGMSRDFLKRVFDPFERERTSSVNGTEGTGLGMPITKRIVDLMKGTIEVESEKDKGTEFVVRLALPFAPEPTPEEEMAKSQSCASDAEPLDFSKMRILLVEDNEINREIAFTVLSHAGFAVDQAENGQVAVEKVLRGGPGFYDAILMDVHMPVMNGYSAARAIRALALPGMRRIPIVALSANAFETDVKEALDAGMDAHIAKPIRIPILMKTLERLLRERGAAGGSRPCAPEKDEDIFASLAKMGCDIEMTLRDTYMGDKPFYERMLSKLPSSAAIVQMRKALDAKDPAALFASSHNLKGLYASLGLTPLHALCSEIVEIARLGGLDGAADRLARLEGLHGEVVAIINGHSGNFKQ